MLETDTFGGSLIKLEEYGLGERTYELNRTGGGARAQGRGSATARRADRASSPGRSARPASARVGRPDARQPPLQEVLGLFLDQIRGLVDGGSDVLIIETVQDILELKAAIHAAHAGSRGKRHRDPDSGLDHARHQRPHVARHRSSPPRSP